MPRLGSLNRSKPICRSKRVISNAVITLQDRYRPPVPSRDYAAHIADNITKGSSLCPFGSLFMQENKKVPDSFEIDGYDPNAPDSDDEPLSDLDDVDM